MNERSLKIKELEDLIVSKQYDEIKMGGWDCIILNNFRSLTKCQILEGLSASNNVQTDELHRHENSVEFFYQIEGTTVFHDGQVIRSGEYRKILPNEHHSAHISKDGICILIIHPIEPNYV